MSETIADKTGPARWMAGPLAAQLARLYAKILAEALAPLGIAPAQLAVLRELWSRDGRTQAELALRLKVEQATMSNTLKRMARDGLICDEPHPEDGRARCIRLTDRSLLLEVPAKEAVKAVHKCTFAGLTRKEQKKFADLAGRAMAALKA